MKWVKSVFSNITQQIKFIGWKLQLNHVAVDIKNQDNCEIIKPQRDMT